ncbi:MAG TPA: isoprenylcysteine carboxylmethyltransferase family protein [Vicinamibacterales bacterium]|jgi:protein-S-isoprenylcysteine O-methyltransferase Ste14|nr:isoprenylcysteine carboxylmethyltransferase family protein [Vicinamibacterales bacterium]
MQTVLSGASYLLMIGALVTLYLTRSLFSLHPMVIAPQLAAIALMMWARLTFGRRSFHVTAAPTEGGLVTTGPYRYIRHPIYAAVCLFVSAGALAHPSLIAGACATLVIGGSIIRLLAEERLLARRYSEYGAYAASTKRMVPYVF